MRALPYLLVLSFVFVALTTRSAGLMVLSWLIVLVAGTWATLQLADARINASARPGSSLLGPQELAALRQRAERQLQAKAQAGNDAHTPSTVGDPGSV